MIELHYLLTVHTHKLRAPIDSPEIWTNMEISSKNIYHKTTYGQRTNLDNLNNQIHCKTNSNNPYATYGITYV